jgi:hypothetical protein
MKHVYAAGNREDLSTGPLEYKRASVMLGRIRDVKPASVARVRGRWRRGGERGMLGVCRAQRGGEDDGRR